MTLFQIVLIVVVAFMSVTIAILYNMVRDLVRSQAMAFKYIAQVKQELATLIQTNTDNLTKQVRCSEVLTKRLNNLEETMKHNHRPYKSKHNASAKTRTKRRKGENLTETSRSKGSYGSSGR